MGHFCHANVMRRTRWTKIENSILKMLDLNPQFGSSENKTELEKDSCLCNRCVVQSIADTKGFICPARWQRAPNWTNVEHVTHGLGRHMAIQIPLVSGLWCHLRVSPSAGRNLEPLSSSVAYFGHQGYQLKKLELQNIKIWIYVKEKNHAAALFWVAKYGFCRNLWTNTAE